jgi:hypothetical protein
MTLMGSYITTAHGFGQAACLTSLEGVSFVRSAAPRGRAGGEWYAFFEGVRP